MLIRIPFTSKALFLCFWKNPILRFDQSGQVYAIVRRDYPEGA